jgi:predicted amidohydrolase YtcJ
LVFSSDWPVVEADPLHAMLEAVRPDRSESVGVMTALEAVTSAAARMVRLPDPTLRVGGPASFVALDEDPRKSLLQGRVPNILATVRHGQVVYGDLP